MRTKTVSKDINELAQVIKELQNISESTGIKKFNRNAKRLRSSIRHPRRMKGPVTLVPLRFTGKEIKRWHTK